MFDDAALNEASSRLTRLQETFAAAGEQLDVAVLRFRDHKLYVKALPAGALCIISERRRQHAGAAHGGQPGGAADRARARRGRRRAGPRSSGAARAGPGARRRARPMLAPPGMRRFRGRTVE